MNTAASLAPTRPVNADLPTSIAQDNRAPVCPKAPDPHVGHDLLTDSQRERAIKHIGELLERAMARYERSGDFGDRGEADRYRLEMQALIRGRSAAQVARMEQERGLV